MRCRMPGLARVVFAAIALLSIETTGARAQSAEAFPAKPVTLIVSWGAGTGIDLIHRAMADVAGKHLGQPVIVDNKAGASGTAGPVAMAATAKPDGYTVAHIPITVLRMPVMQKVSWKPMEDFTWIIHVSGFLFGTVVKADSPFKTFNDMVEWARANPGKLTYASPGSGTSLHIGMELMAKKAGIQWTQVPFVTGLDAAILGGHVMAGSSGIGTLWGQIEAGNMRLLATWTEHRAPRAPDAPTLKEVGFPFVFDSPFGIAGPKGVPAPIVKKLHDAFKAALDDPKVLETMRKYDYPLRYMDTATYDRFVRDLYVKEKEGLELIGLARKD